MLQTLKMCEECVHDLHIIDVLHMVDILLAFGQIYSRDRAAFERNLESVQPLPIRL